MPGDLAVPVLGHDVRCDGRALLVRQPLEQRERQAGDLVVGGRRLRRRDRLGVPLRHQALVEALLRSRPAAVIGQPPGRDRVEPRLRGRPAGPEAPARDEGSGERLGREVTREHPIARAPGEERLDGTRVAGVEGAERVRVGRAQQVVVAAGVFDHAW